jgi:hypothetical protein
VVKTKTGLNQIRAQGAAFKIAQEYGFRHPRDIDLEAVAIDRGLKLKFGGIAGCEARLVRLGDRGVVRIRLSNPSHPRTRYAISHEIGHFELHPDTQTFFCTANDLRDYRKDPKESEANAFASELLMPSGLLRPVLAKKDLSIATATFIASEFNVSLTAASIRLCLEKTDESYLVLSRNGNVEWASRHSDRQGIWIERNQRLSDQSNAWHLCKQAEEAPVVETVDSGCWFPEFDNSENSIEVCEQSFSLGGTGYVLTILLVGDS